MPETTKKTIGTKLSHHFEISRNNVGHVEESFISNVRQKLSRLRGDDMSDIDINAMIFFKLSDMRDILEKDFKVNLGTAKNADFEKVRRVFEIS